MSRSRRETAPWLLVLGGTSELGLASARVFAANGFSIMLAGRDHAALTESAASLEEGLGVDTTVTEFDALREDPGFVDRLPLLPDVVLCAVGRMEDRDGPNPSAESVSEVTTVNYAGLVPVLGELGRRMRRRGHGHIIGVTSMAGIRGRAGNMVYGSAKAGMITFLSGLRQSLHRSGVHVTTVIPGYLATRMIRGLHTPALLTLQPQQAAERIFRSYRSRRRITHLGARWWLIAWALRLMPEWLFVRLGGR